MDTHATSATITPHKNGTEQHDVATEEESTVTNPIVFQCLYCRSIIGDSLSLAEVDSSNRVILSSIVKDSVIMGNEAEVSEDPRDELSTIVYIHCRHPLCFRQDTKSGRVIGKFFQCTPPQLDVHRDRFTFESADLSSYQLGAANLQSIKSQTPQLMQGVSRALEMLIEHEERIIAMQKEIDGLKFQLALHPKADSFPSAKPNGNGNINPPQPDLASRFNNSRSLPASSTNPNMTISTPSSSSTTGTSTKKRIAPTPISKISTPNSKVTTRLGVK